MGDGIGGGVGSTCFGAGLGLIGAFGMTTGFVIFILEGGGAGADGVTVLEPV